MATLIIDHSQNCLENSPREGLKKKLNMAFPSHFLLVFYSIGFSPTIACVPTVTWHCTTAELFQKTSGASVTTLEVNDHNTNNASGPCDERPFAFSVYPVSCMFSLVWTHPKSAQFKPTGSQSQLCFLFHLTIPGQGLCQSLHPDALPISLIS